MKLGLLGGTGQLGRQIILGAKQRGHSVSAPASGDVDITNSEQVHNWVAQTSADCWINCAAYTAVDAAEEDISRAEAINIQGAGNFANALKETGTSAALYYFSTDYVFDGNKGSPYVETDTTNPQSVYGRTKLAGEQASLGYPHALVLRISWVFGLHGHNFVKAILRAARGFAKNGGALTVVDDQFGAPCGTRAIANTLFDIHERNIPAGVYHFATQPHINWHEFASAIVDACVAKGLLSKPVDVLRQPTSALNQAATRPPDGRLNSTRLQNALGSPPPLWADDLDAMLDELNPADLDN